MSRLVCYVDGACSGNPGPMGVGVVILDEIDGAMSPPRLVAEKSLHLGHGSNNIAELRAIQTALRDLPRHRSVVVATDSQYAIGVLSKGWKATANADLVSRIRDLVAEFRDLKFLKVAGHSGDMYNDRADALARAGAARRQS